MLEDLAIVEAEIFIIIFQHNRNLDFQDKALLYSVQLIEKVHSFALNSY